MDINTLTLVGRLTRDPEVRHLANDNAVATLSLAVKRVWYNSNREKQEDTTFVPVDVWGGQAKTVEKFCQKGALLGITGRLALDQWEDKESGEKRSKLKVVAETISLGPKNGENKSSDGDFNFGNNKKEGSYTKRTVRKLSKNDTKESDSKVEEPQEVSVKGSGNPTEPLF